MENASLVRCPGCGGFFPDVSGPVHRYMESSPGCWAAYGRVLAREYSTGALQNVHRLSVDAYAAQHPGRPSPQSMKAVRRWAQSVWTAWAPHHETIRAWTERLPFP